MPRVASRLPDACVEVVCIPFACLDALPIPFACLGCFAPAGEIEQGRSHKGPEDQRGGRVPGENRFAQCGRGLADAKLAQCHYVQHPRELHNPVRRWLCCPLPPPRDPHCKGVLPAHGRQVEQGVDRCALDGVQASGSPTTGVELREAQLFPSRRRVRRVQRGGEVRAPGAILVLVGGGGGGACSTTPGSIGWTPATWQ